ncbi:predicted protein [Naegleria gruberi]|uniref:Predicted protein n=1 Tax=Naegleria gruberi TaxID=5762 RepID=D2W2S3_NAEGR|nr:uncharacterized protein NAEGRDRAFT_75693 [Naegleria gruberi]EFC36602.1 predicted protein [Naegleria gruberi]|eukprot:XP_002669346.1 predicted protein [Naegleria gruberi strain NEG-M]
MSGNNKKGTPQRKQHAVSSPSHPKQRVEVFSPSDSSSSATDTTARIYADDRIANPENQNSGLVSSGAAALANALNLKQSDSNNYFGTGKRERDSEGISLKEYLRDCYQSITGESINDELSSDDIFELILSTSNEQYSADSEFKNRMAFLQRVFREEVDAPVPDVYGGKEFRSKGYPLLLAQSHIIVQVCKRLRNGNSFDLVEWLQAIEFIHNIADLNCIAIKLGAGSGGFEAAKEFVNTYKSGGTIDNITSKQQQKAIKKGEKLREERPKKSGSGNVSHSTSYLLVGNANSHGSEAIILIIALINSIFNPLKYYDYQNTTLNNSASKTIPMYESIYQQDHQDNLQ